MRTFVWTASLIALVASSSAAHAGVPWSISDRARLVQVLTGWDGIDPFGMSDCTCSDEASDLSFALGTWNASLTTSECSFAHAEQSSTFSPFALVGSGAVSGGTPLVVPGLCLSLAGSEEGESAMSCTFTVTTATQVRLRFLASVACEDCDAGPFGEAPHARVTLYAAAGPLIDVEATSFGPSDSDAFAALLTLTPGTYVLSAETSVATTQIENVFWMNESSASFLAAIEQTCAASDLSGDGTVNGADLAILLSSWGTGGAADLDLNGVVNAADLSILLSSWGGC